MLNNRKDLSPYDPALAATADIAPWPLGTPFEQWRDAQGIPIHGGFAVEDVTALETAPWELIGAEAAFLNLDGALDTTGQYVIRLAPRAATNWLKLMYEEITYTVTGTCILEVENKGTISSCKMHEGSMVAIPLNRRFRYLAGEDGTQLFCVNGAPPVMNLFHNPSFLWDNSFEFDDRFDGSEDFFNPMGKFWERSDGPGGRIWESNFVEDVPRMDLVGTADRGGRGSGVVFQFGESTLVSHVSEFEPVQYKKAHRHGAGSTVVVVSGEGYSLLWQGEFEDHVRVNWKKHSVVVPPDYWWHQHFNAASDPARYLAIRWGGRKYRFNHAHEGASVDRRDGGNQIEYDDQSPEIERIFGEEKTRKGVIST